MKCQIDIATSPIAYQLIQSIGDKWTLIIICDMAFARKNTFREFMQSDEGIASNILTDRLKTMESNGFIEKLNIPGKSRVGYWLTDKGISLIPVLVEIAIWGIDYSLNDSEKRTALNADFEIMKPFYKNKKEAIAGLSELLKRDREEKRMLPQNNKQRTDEAE
jgi:DNA-binding HxlR family transcriptional regulator